MSIILSLILIFMLLVLLSQSFRGWLLSLLLVRLQRRLQGQAEEAMGFRSRTGRGESSREREEHRASHPSGKQEMGEIEARRFSKGSNDEYVDFEELPK